MPTEIVLFTRDLRVHDHPALTAAIAAAPNVTPLFVLDREILASRYASANRLALLLDALRDLRGALRRRGGDLVVRRGDVVREVALLASRLGAERVHVSADVSRYARRRTAGLRGIPGVEVVEHEGLTVAPPGSVTTTTGGAYRVFTPYWRRWQTMEPRRPHPAPDRLTLPDDVDPGVIPELAELTDARPAPGRPPGGEDVGRAAAEAFFAADADPGDRDRPAVDATSRLSLHLHLGTISPTELAVRADPTSAGQGAFVRQLCWREFHVQLLAAEPRLVVDDLRPRGDRWIDDPDGFEAWIEGRTGYPLVDAGMRQLRTEGWMHNRARMVTASFLTKHLRIDWRPGAWHFMDHLVDGDLAVNFGQWQWVAGTGTDPRPNRMLNPTAQSRRHDPQGAYLRRHVPELADVDDDLVHEPWSGGGPGPDGYPAPIVDHGWARGRFLAARGG